MALCQLLGEQNFPAIAIHRSMTQEERLSRYQQFKDFKKVRSCYCLTLRYADDYRFKFQRILVATDLFGRGMDIERVNIVFNYDMPENSDSYLHRVARAGRFGTKVRHFFTVKLKRVLFEYFGIGIGDYICQR